MPQRKLFVVIEVLAFDFELFISARGQKQKAGNTHKLPANLFSICNLLDRFNRVDSLKQMFGKDYQVLYIDYAITPGHWTNVTKGIICALPMYTGSSDLIYELPDEHLL
jgi:hypothetical protein